MSDLVRIELEPLGRSLVVERGTPLQDVLFAYGVEFPCGGHGRCRRCRVKVLDGSLEVTPEQARILTGPELAEGWRLACHSRAEGALKLDIAQWETAILADDSQFEFTPGQGLGIAIDLGTTTLVAQLLDLRTAHVLAVRTALNPQAAFGADIMSRVEFALDGHGQRKLQDLIRSGLGRLVRELLAAARTGEASVSKIVLVGNTVMHHLFCGVGVEPLSHVPFEPSRDGLEVFPAADLGWDVPGNPPALFLPCLGGFVGSDILAGLLATRMPDSESLIGLIDLGTNGEISFGTRERIVCASTAAGPAFEGGRISAGMRASTGAISEVSLRDGQLHCHVLGGGPPRGICGSGLVDAVAAGLDLGVITPRGNLAGNGLWMLAPPVALAQRDIRELQLAKAAIAAGIRIVLRRLGAEAAEVTRLYLAGAFGNYISRTSARRIGLIDFPEEKVEPAGNTALLGAKLALFATPARPQVEHISLASDPDFQDIYVEEMNFEVV
ncbi:MAG: ASKHA domain-containing protein [Acidobacteriota bacterium]